jgi:signal transduction histidine kinase
MRIILPLLLEERIDKLGPRQRELLDAVRADAVRLHQIVENLLDLGRIAAGKVVMEMRPADPGQLVRQAIERVQAAFLDRPIDIRACLPESAPRVLADATRIGHVLANLLDNAQRYSRDGGIVNVSLRELDDVVEFSVSDCGSGIPRQYLPRIFEKFFRVPGQSGDAGSGLGLAIVKDIVEAHGGGIVAESVEGRGSTFRFTLRRADRADLLAKETHHEFDRTSET